MSDFEMNAEATAEQTSEARAEATETATETGSAAHEEAAGASRDPFLEGLFGESDGEVEYETEDDSADREEEEAANEGTEETEAENGETETEPPQTYTLKHLGKDREVTLEEMTEFAQKGMDYDRVREGYDAYQRYKDDIAAVNEMREMFGKSARDLLNDYREQSFENDVQARKQEILSEYMIDEEMAEHIARLETERQANQREREQREQKAAAAEEKEKSTVNRRLDEIQQLLELRPELKKPENQKLPEEVIARVRNENVPLPIAYLDWENTQKQIEIEQMKQSEKNKQRSIGSLKGGRREEENDPFLKGLFSDY